MHPIQSQVLWTYTYHSGKVLLESYAPYTIPCVMELIPHIAFHNHHMFFFRVQMENRHLLTCIFDLTMFPLCLTRKGSLLNFPRFTYFFFCSFLTTSSASINKHSQKCGQNVIVCFQFSRYLL
jgi:hypothetical protein